MKKVFLKQFSRVWKSTFWVWKKFDFCKKIVSYPRVWKYQLFFPDGNILQSPKLRKREIYIYMYRDNVRLSVDGLIFSFLPFSDLVTEIHQEKTCEDITPYGVITQFPKNGRLFTPKYRFITPSTFDHTEKNLITPSIFKITPS